MRASFFAVLSVVSWALFSCGEGEERVADPIMEDPVLLTTENAQSIVSALWLGHAVTESEEIFPPQVRDILDDYLRLLAYRPNDLSMEIACEQEGTVTVYGTVNDLDHPGATAGDQAVASFHNCKETYESVIPELTNGTLTVEVVAADGESREVAIALDDLTWGMGVGALVQNGEATATFSADGSETAFTSDLLTVVGMGATRILKDYLLILEVPAEGETLLTFSGTQSGGELNGSLTFETVTPFHAAPYHYPDAGELLLTGADESTVRMTAQPDAETVILAVNGDETLETTWLALEE